MAISLCRECHKEVSSQATSCPHCGAPRPSAAQWQGTGFEWRSAQSFYGYPLIHIAFGKDAQGRRRVAKGVIAVGQFAVGVITVAQFGVGLLFGFGQFMLGLTAVAQFAGALWLGAGQFATGYVAIGQIVLAKFGLAQLGWAEFLWSSARRDPEAVEFFQNFWSSLRAWF